MLGTGKNLQLHSSLVHQKNSSVLGVCHFEWTTHLLNWIYRPSLDTLPQYSHDNPYYSVTKTNYRAHQHHIYATNTSSYYFISQFKYHDKWHVSKWTSRHMKINKLATELCNIGVTYTVACLMELEYSTFLPSLMRYAS